MGEFRVATYNVHSCIGLDRRFAPERIAQAIRALDADVVAVQECGWHHRGARHFDQFSYLANATGYSVIEAPTKLHARAHYGNALLVRAPVVTHRVIDLSNPLHIPRGCVLAEVSFGDFAVTILNAHLGLTPWDRGQQIRRLAREIAEVDGPLVLMGDFNNWSPHGAIGRRLAHRLPYCTGFVTFPARAPRLPLDRIYLSPELVFVDARAVRTPLTAVASDHLPVIADIRRAVRQQDGVAGTACA
ncbi:MAG: endonuclease/exonuclease/phosphatase family protein [Rhodothalassiaceae bacterium]